MPDARQPVRVTGPRAVTPTSRRARKKQATRQAIYDVAIRLFMERGYDETTIDDIAGAADVSRATFFNYYASKPEILHEIAAEALEYARCTFDRNFSRAGDSIAEKVRRSLRSFAMIVERDPRYYQTVFLDAMRSQAGFVAANRDAANRLINDLTGHMRAAQRAGELNPSLDAGQLAEMLTGIYMYAILSYILKGCSGSLVERIDKAAMIFLEGCQAR
ncbi:MAG: TetR family transcriptional regulator [Gammaproteobacteria bacterium]|nr:TetR family transcriptional regulator [Gammaproteobacteria bacterium]